jgi:hypothetical protein
MDADAKQKIQLALIFAILVAAGRAGYILYERHEDAVAAEKQKKAQTVGYSNPDYYVTPKKLYPYDLKSAKEITKQPVWAKEGYRYTYYPYRAGKVDFDHEAGLLLPIERIEIKDIITATAHGAGNRKQVMAVFQKNGESYAVPIGFESEGQYKIYSDEMFYIEDPHELYKHWSADAWQSVDHHEMKVGMTEMQGVLALGMGVPDSGATSYEKIVRYPNGGKPLVIIYHNGKATEIKPGTPAS